MSALSAMACADPVFEALGLQQLDAAGCTTFKTLGHDPGQSAAAAAARPGDVSVAMPPYCPWPPAPPWSVYAQAAAAAAAAAAFSAGSPVLQGASSSPLLLPDVLPSDRRPLVPPPPMEPAAAAGARPPLAPPASWATTQPVPPPVLSIWPESSWQPSTVPAELSSQEASSPNRQATSGPTASSPTPPATPSGALGEKAAPVELSLTERAAGPASIEETPEPRSGKAVGTPVPVSLMLATPPPRSAFRADAPAFVPSAPLAAPALAGEAQAAKTVAEDYETPSKALAPGFVEARAQMLRVRHLLESEGRGKQVLTGSDSETPVRFSTRAMHVDGEEDVSGAGESPAPPAQSAEEKAVASARLLQFLRGGEAASAFSPLGRAPVTPGGSARSALTSPPVHEAPLTPGPQPVGSSRLLPPAPAWVPDAARMPAAPQTPPPPLSRLMQTPSPPAASPDLSGTALRRSPAAPSAAAFAALGRPVGTPPALPSTPHTAEVGSGTKATQAKGTGKGESRSRIRALAAAARAATHEQRDKDEDGSGGTEGSGSESDKVEIEAGDASAGVASGVRRRKRAGARRRGARQRAAQTPGVFQ